MSFDILIVDDEKDIRDLVEGVLVDEGYHTRQAASSDEAFECVAEKVPDLVILDIWLQESKLDGMEILEKLNGDFPELPIIMISGHGNIETAVSAIKIGAYDFIEKPFKSDRLLLMVKRGIEHSRLKKENIKLKTKLSFVGHDEIIGKSTIITNLKNNLEKIAPTNSRVLVTGEAGTGKNIVAKHIHNISDRKDMAFVTLGCACVDPLKLEAEIFGKEENGEIYKGAFENADGGTLLLDEVSDLPLSIQARLVKILQEQSFQRINGVDDINVNVRVISTSTKNLVEMMEKKEFRQDLYFRLNVVPIDIAPLREHVEDIEELCSFFIKLYAKKHGVKEIILDNNAISMLQSHSWPGNVRQLRNVVDWLMIMNAHGKDSRIITADDLPPEIGGRGTSKISGNSMVEFMGLELREAREKFEKIYIEGQLNKFGGNVSKTAKFIGMERSALHRKIKSLGIIEKIAPNWR